MLDSSFSEEGWFGYRAITWLTAVTGAVITIAVWSMVLGHERQKALVLFEQQASPMITAVAQRLTADLDVVHSIRNFYLASGRVDRNEFRIFVDNPLKRYSNIQALEWMPRVSHAQRGEYEAAARRDGLEGFVIREQREGEMVAAAERPEYYPVYFVEPLASNLDVVGFDLASNPERLAALEKARDSGEAVATGRISLVQETGKHTGFIFFVPVYRDLRSSETLELRRRNIIGFALGVYRIGDLVASALEKGGFVNNRIRLSLFDRTAEASQQLLYSNIIPGEGNATGELSVAETLRGNHLANPFNVGGREWLLVAQPDKEALNLYFTLLPIMALMLGAAFTLIALYFLRVTNTRNRVVQALVKKQTRRLQRSEAYNKAVHDTVVDGIITINPQGIIQSCNPATGRMFGYDNSKLPGKKINVLMPEHYAHAHDGYLAAYMETGEAHIIGAGREVEGLRSNGTTFPLDLAVSRMEIGGETFFTGVVRDITERKRVDRMKAEFISTVSHELRTPLTSIRGAMGLVAGGAAGELPEQAKKLIDIAASNSERLVRLINDILDVEKIEAGKMQFDRKQQPVLTVIKRAIEENRGYAETHGAAFHLSVTDGDLLLDIDADRLRQVLDNLLSNAVKYGGEGDRVEVILSRKKRDALISVIDHGVGIPREFQDRIFGKFAQADASDTRQKGGTGLGLSIAKAIVKHHGGRLWFETEEGKGTRFIISLPIPEPVQETAFEISPDSRVLVCEDDADIGRLLQLLLEKANITSDLARSAGEAMAMLRQHDYKAMTLDLNLPDRDGLSLLSDLRKSESFSELPVVVVSGAPSGDTETVGALRISDWLCKPISEPRLLHAVKQAMISLDTGTTARVLHVEDDPDIATVVASMLEGVAEIELATGLAEAGRWLDRERFDLVILDIGLPDGSGLDLLPRLTAFSPAIPVVIFSAQELDSQILGQVAGGIVKSRSDNQKLVTMVKDILNAPARPGG